MKKVNSTWLFGIIVVAMGVYAYFGEYKKDAHEKETKAKNTAMVSMAKDVVDSITIHQGPDEIKLKRSGQGWQMTAPVDDQADKESVENFLDGIVNDHYSDVANEGNVNWADYGLDKPQGTLILTEQSGQQTKFVVSPKKNFEGNALVRRNDEERVLVADPLWVERVSRKPSSFRERRIYRGDIGAVDSIEFQNKLGKIHLVKKDGFWTDTSEHNYEIEQNRVRELLTDINETKAEDFLLTHSPTAAEKKAFYLVKPSIEIRFKSGGTGWFADLGEGTARDAYAYTSSPLLVVKLNNGALDRFKSVDLLSLRESHNAFKFDDTSVTKINATNELKTTTFKKDVKGWILDPGDSGFSVSQEKVAELIGHLSHAKVFAYIPLNDQTRFKPKKTIELVDDKGGLIFKIEWSGLAKAHIAGVEKNVVLVRTNKNPEIFAMEEPWANGLDITPLLEKPQGAPAEQKEKK